MKLQFSLLILVVVGLGFSACKTQTLHNRQLWYKVSVPNTWKAGQDAVIRSDKGDVLEISRVRDDGSLESVVESRRRAFQISMAGFVIESEKWLKVSGHKAWQLVGTHRKKDSEVVHIKIIVDAKEYKYFLEFRTPSESYRKRRPIIREVIRSFFFKIPSY